MLENGPNSPKPTLDQMTPEQRNEPRFVTPGSMMAKIHGRIPPAFFGLTPIIEHLAKPEVADSLRRRKFQNNPIRRTVDTFNAGVDMIHGTHEESLRVSGHINDIHTRVKGSVEGVRYTAEDVELLKWVGATLGQAAVVGYELGVGKLNMQEKDQYVRELGPFYHDLHLPVEAFPQTYQELETYVESAEIEVTDAARMLQPYAVLSHDLKGKILMSYFRMALLATIPDNIRRKFNTVDPKTGKKTIRLQKLTQGQRRFLEGSLAVVRAIDPILPSLRDYYKFRRRFGLVANYKPASKH